MKRLNDFTLQLDVGDPTPYELGWWSGRGLNPERPYTAVPKPEDESLSNDACNFFKRSSPWNTRDGRITRQCMIGAPREKLDAICPQRNEWGEVSP